MLVEEISNVLYSIFALLTSPISIPSMPPGVLDYANTLGEYIAIGAGILTVYTDLTYLLSLFSIILLIDIGVMLYNIVMWVLRKIPFTSIS